MSDPPRVVVSCEHGGNLVPKRYRRLFAGREALLRSHRGWDPGALPLARAVARELSAPLRSTRITRLLVEPNRSLHHPRLFSEISRALPPEERRRVLETWYHPHREAVAAEVARGNTAAGWTLHLSIHTFTPVLDGTPRNVEIGLLYDPGRKREAELCRRLGREIRLRLEAPGKHPRGEGRGRGPRVRMNRPYRGSSDGLTTWLRTIFPDACYGGVEIEVSQGLILEGGTPWRRARAALLESLRAVTLPTPPDAARPERPPDGPPEPGRRSS